MEETPVEEQRAAFTLGYGGHRTDDLLALVGRHDLVVVDIRLAPRSRQSGWGKPNLERLLGDRYVHVPALGNVNYRSGGPIELADPEAGLALIRSTSRTVVLMCACRSPVGCHRATVAELLRAEGWTVEELDWSAGDSPSDVVQIALPITPCDKR